MRNVLIAQIFLIFAMAAIYAGAAGVPSALAAAYGVGIALTNSLLLAWRISRGSKAPGDVGRQLRSFYASAIERYVMVAVLFVIGISELTLAPLPLLIGFVAGQAALLMTGLTSRIQ